MSSALAGSKGSHNHQEFALTPRVALLTAGTPRERVQCTDLMYGPEAKSGTRLAPIHSRRRSARPACFVGPLERLSRRTDSLAVRTPEALLAPCLMSTSVNDIGFCSQ